jgi:hypothetical protein
VTVFVTVSCEATDIHIVSYLYIMGHDEKLKGNVCITGN